MPHLAFSPSTLQLAAAAALALTAAVAAAQGGDTAALRLEVTVPDKAVMYVVDSGDPQARGTAFATEFDLRCAAEGGLPDDLKARCVALYPDDDESRAGRLRDLQGRPYPPTAVNATGDTVPGSFPQFFAARTNTLRVFVPAPSWSLSVAFDGPDNDLQRPLPVDALAVAATVRSDRGGTATEHAAQQTCLAYHQAWTTSEAFKAMACPENAPDAALTPSGVPVARLAANPGGWHQVDLSLYLRLDGDEPAGQYSGVLRYTLVDF